MPKRLILTVSILSLIGWARVARAQDAAAAELDTAKVEQLTGAKGKMNDKEGVFNVNVPREDLKVDAGGVNIVAIHNHMTGESPRIMFLHFWGVGSTTDLAKGIKAALDTQGK
jgi:hypothetical protein